VKLTLNHINYEGGNGLTHYGRADVGEVEPQKGGKLRVYARSKNVLRIKSGMAGLAYAN